VTNFFKVLSVAVFCTALFGCADFRNVTKTDPVREKFNTYNVMQEKKVSVGQVMVANVDAKYFTAVVSDNDFTPVSDHGPSSLPVSFGEKWGVYGTMDNGDYVAFKSVYYMKFGDYDRALIVSKENGQVYGDLFYDRTKGLAAKFIFRQHVLAKENVFKTTKIYVNGSKKSELIYNGKSKNNIKLSFREYKDSLESAFNSQDLQYDLEESKDINFQGINIQVVDATNSEIKFKVLNVPQP
jgi:hypothetical protein